MAERPLGDFNIPSPEMPSSEGEEASLAQKPLPDNIYDSTGLLPVRDKRRAFRRATTKPDVDETEEDGSSSSELDEASSEEDNSDESDDETDQIKRSACATSSKESVPDSDVESSSSSDFLEDAPKKRKRLPLITNGSEQIEQSGGKVSLIRTRRSWSQLCQFDTSTTSQTEVRTAMMSSAVSDFLGGGTPEPTGITYIYVHAISCMIYCSIKIFLAADV
jgi:hypothetical protein